MKEQDQDNGEEIFRAGTILADLNNAQREAAGGSGGKGVGRQMSTRKPGEPLVTLSPKERPVVELQQQQQQRSARPSISGQGGADLSRSGTRGGGGGAASASGGADLARSGTRGAGGHHPLVSVDVHRKATTRSARTAGTAHTTGASSSKRGAVDNDAHSASSSTGTLNDEHDLLSTFRATGHGDLGLGSGFSNNVPVSSVIRIEDDDTSTVLSSSFPNANRSFMEDFATSFPQQSSRSGGRARQSGDMSSAADDYRVTATRSGTVKSHVSKRSVGRSGSQSKLQHQRQRDGSSQPSTSPPRTSAYLLPHIDTDMSLGAVMGPTSATIPSPPPYRLAAEKGAPLARQTSSRSERRTAAATGVDRSRSTRSRAASIYDDEDEREARSAAVDASSSRRRRSSRSRTREQQQAMSPPAANRLPRSPADVGGGGGGGAYGDEEYTAYADDESGHRQHHHHRERQNDRLGPAAAAAVSRTRSTRVAGDASLSATGVKRSGTSRSTRHHESSGDASGVSRSASSSKPSNGGGSGTTTTTHRTASTRSRRHHANNANNTTASDDETPLASVALQALQQSMGGLVVPQPVPAPPPHHSRRPSKAKARRSENDDGYDDDGADEEDVPLGQLARQASVT
ncbi:hypothetical protein HDU87_001931 [Geranomyces variabilis]|uniref:Uncharacterized protein n=1 Tax=Geranomyces variabilis TaxID=109894 RepID=A0AAD5TM99_9FUNG|nr:hypothetical protein HDU87_001931 [Geranomyces variabilis]